MEKELNLFKALGLFIREMRTEFKNICFREYGIEWGKIYANSFPYDKPKEDFIRKIDQGQKPEDLIDFGNLAFFTEKNRDKSFLWKRFNKESKKLSTYFKDISEIRNQLMHFNSIDNDEYMHVYSDMHKVLKTLGLKELEEKIKTLRPTSHVQFKQIENNSVHTKKPKSKSKRVSPKKIRDLVYRKIGKTIKSNQLNVSRITGQNEFWLNPNLNRKEQIWFLLLVNQNKRVIDIFEIPAKDSIYDQFEKRSDKNVYSLKFNVDDPNYIELNSRVSFKPYLLDRITYEEGDI